MNCFSLKPMFPIIFSAMFLSACGGGGGDTNPEDDNSGDSGDVILPGDDTNSSNNGSDLGSSGIAFYELDVIQPGDINAVVKTISNAISPYLDTDGGFKFGGDDTAFTNASLGTGFQQESRNCANSGSLLTSSTMNGQLTSLNNQRVLEPGDQLIIEYFDCDDTTLNATATTYNGKSTFTVQQGRASGTDIDSSFRQTGAISTYFYQNLNYISSDLTQPAYSHGDITTEFNDNGRIISGDDIAYRRPVTLGNGQVIEEPELTFADYNFDIVYSVQPGEAELNIGANLLGTGRLGSSYLNYAFDMQISTSLLRGPISISSTSLVGINSGKAKVTGSSGRFDIEFLSDRIKYVYKSNELDESEDGDFGGTVFWSEIYPDQ